MDESDIYKLCVSPFCSLAPYLADVTLRESLSVAGAEASKVERAGVKGRGAPASRGGEMEAGDRGAAGSRGRDSLCCSRREDLISVPLHNPKGSRQQHLPRWKKTSGCYSFIVWRGGGGVFS